MLSTSTRAGCPPLGHVADDGLEGDAFVGLVGLARAAGLEAVEAAAVVVEADELPGVVEDGAPRATRLGGRSVVDLRLAHADDQVVLHRDVELPPVRVAHDPGPFGAVGLREVA